MAIRTLHNNYRLNVAPPGTAMQPTRIGDRIVVIDSHPTAAAKNYPYTTGSELSGPALFDGRMTWPDETTLKLHMPPPSLLDKLRQWLGWK
jgi:hypothetical protein